MPNLASTLLQIQASDRPIIRTLEVSGLTVKIENPRGSIKEHPDGSSSRLPHHYGYVEGVEGDDGDSLDCYIGYALNAEKGYLINQLNLQTGEADESKLMLGFIDAGRAKTAYISMYPKEMFGGISVVHLDKDRTIDGNIKALDCLKNHLATEHATDELSAGGPGSGIYDHKHGPESPKEILRRRVKEAIAKIDPEGKLSKEELTLRVQHHLAKKKSSTPEPAISVTKRNIIHSNKSKRIRELGKDIPGWDDALDLVDNLSDVDGDNLFASLYNVTKVPTDTINNKKLGNLLGAYVFGRITLCTRSTTRIMLHELGHNLSETKLRTLGDTNYIGKRYEKLLGDTLQEFNTAKIKNKGITHYSLTDKHEWFAEAFASYVTGEPIKDSFPATHRLISKVLQRKDIKASLFLLASRIKRTSHICKLPTSYEGNIQAGGVGSGVYQHKKWAVPKLKKGRPAKKAVSTPARNKANPESDLLKEKRHQDFLEKQRHIGKQQRAKLSKKGVSARGKPIVSEKAKRALANMNVATKDMQDKASNCEADIAKAVGGKMFIDNKPFDVEFTSKSGKKHGIEVKAVLVQKNDKITMKKDAIDRKNKYAKANKMHSMSTVVVDYRINADKPTVYYRQGVGSFRIGSMEKVKGGFKGLKKLYA